MLVHVKPLLLLFKFQTSSYLFFEFSLKRYKILSCLRAANGLGCHLTYNPDFLSSTRLGLLGMLYWRTMHYPIYHQTLTLFFIG